MARVNQEEYEVLKGLDDKWKWIARDRDMRGYVFSEDELWVYEYKPERQSNFWMMGEEGEEGESIVFPYDDLFRFIQWDDPEPYSIAELIEGYEYSADHVSHVVNERVKALGKAWSESEETEVKSKQELIEKWESAIEAAGFYGKGKEEKLISYMKDFVSDLNQLDEPEVLSQEWIDDHEYIRMDPDNPFVYVKDLQNLLVPKQEEVGRAYKAGYETGKQHTYYKGYLEGLADKESINPERSLEVDQHKELLDELNDLYARKNQDYGNSFDESLDEDGLLVLKIRLGDKYKRFSTLINQKNEVVDESMRDTLIDLANYALMGVMWMDSQEKN